MLRFGAVAFLAAISIAIPARAEPAPDEEALRRHIAYLASDALEGRAPGGPGEALSADYIARHFAEIGLEPGYGDGFLDHVELVDRRAGATSLRWNGARNTVEIAPDEVIGFGRTASERFAGLPMVFVGYGRGLADPGAMPVDVEGAAVLLLADAPGVEQGVADFEQRVRMLTEAGAAVILGLTLDGPSWDVVAEMAGRGLTAFEDAPMARARLMLSPAASAARGGGAGYDAARIARRASQNDFAPAGLALELSGEVETGVFPITGHNVLGRLPGRRGGGEAVLFLAHHDHLGLCRPVGAPDRICNGAIDNASGVAQLIEIAEGLAAGERPDRDVYFLATTAEELGLFGARAFADDPPIGLDRFVAAINLDTVATSPAGSRLTIVGRGMTPIDPVIARVAAALGRTNYEGEELNAFVARQDGKVLLDAGIPSVLVGGIHAVSFQRFLVGPYHGPNDELSDDTDLSGAAEDVAFHVALGRALADPAQYRPPPR